MGSEALRKHLRVNPPEINPSPRGTTNSDTNRPYKGTATVSPTGTKKVRHRRHNPSGVKPLAQSLLVATLSVVGVGTGLLVLVATSSGHAIGVCS